MRVIFCNVTWMEYYNGVVDGENIPIDKKNSEEDIECFNFCAREDGNYYGYVSTKTTKGREKGIQIENIKDIENESEEAENVLVIWVAKDPFQNKNNIIGWYKNATVYRNSRVDENERSYNICAKIEDCLLLPINKRHKIVPKAGRAGYTYGMRASSIWYGNEDDKSAENYIKNMIEYINKYDGDNLALNNNY